MNHNYTDPNKFSYGKFNLTDLGECEIYIFPENEFIDVPHFHLKSNKKEFCIELLKNSYFYHGEDKYDILTDKQSYELDLCMRAHSPIGLIGEQSMWKSICDGWDAWKDEVNGYFSKDPLISEINIQPDYTKLH